MRLPCAVCLAVILVSCGTKNTPGVKIDPQLKPYIPPKTKAVAGIHLDEIKRTDFYKRHQSQLAVPMIDNFAERTGVDPRRDLSTFLVAWDGSKILGLLHGSFDSTVLENRMRESSAQVEKFNNFQIYETGDRAAAFLPEGVALFGPISLIKTSVTNKSTGDDLLPDDLQLQLARINSSAQVWLASSGVIPLDQIPVRSDTATMLSNILGYINATAAGVTFASGANLDAHISCISEEGAQRVHDALRGLIGIARLSTPDNNLDQLKLWDAIHVDKDTKQVHIYAALTPELTDKLLSLLPAATRRLEKPM